MENPVVPSIFADAAKDERGLPSYVLITPAHNEAEFIEETIKSVVQQSVLPLKWIIVSDGSTDGTDKIVTRYIERYPWMELICVPQHSERHFASKAHAFNAGYVRLGDLEYEVIGNIDADVSFGPSYMQFLLGKFAQQASLGVAGTAFTEGSVATYDFHIVNIADVAGACQLFRRKCFEEIGGYIPIKGGGIDSVAVYTARMKGWQTRTFPEESFVHLRKMWTGQGAALAGFFRTGKRDYCLGGHPLWECIRSIYQMKRKPFVVGGLLLMSGYLWEWLRQVKRPISDDLVQFLRREQMQRLKIIVKGLVVRGQGRNTGCN